MDITYILMLPVLEFLDKTLGSYGWAILGLTLAVRIAVWPLVAAQTKSMQQMSRLQPILKGMQEKYKDEPAVLQKKMAEFYLKNKVNPLSGCLPLLVQLPILFALFGTFNGPPFQDKAIPVKVNIKNDDAANKTTITVNPTSSADSAYVSKDGKLCKFVVHPGDATLILGRNVEGQVTKDGFNKIDFSLSACQGEMPQGFKSSWKISLDPNRASIGENGQGTFPCQGEIVVAAVLPKEILGEEKQIPVKVKVLPKAEGEGGGLPFGGSSEDSIKEKKELSETTIESSINGKTLKLAVEPGNLTIVSGKQAQFKIKVLEGKLPENTKINWKIVDDPNAASIDEEGKAIFKRQGEVVVEAMIPGEAKTEPFYFINSIGKVAKGQELFSPENWDVLSLIILFGLTMYLSQKVMVTTPSSDPEQAAIQKQTQQIMPFTVTGMFFFIPLPAGVYLYMVFSNVVQTLQTWLLMKSPAPALQEVDEDVYDSSNNTITIVPKDKQLEKKSDQGSGDSEQNTVKLSDLKKQGKKK